MPDPQAFPSYGHVSAKPELDELARLLKRGLFDTDYIDAKSAAALLSAGMQAYRDSVHNERWEGSEILSRVSPSIRPNLVCAALFDLLCNAEYLHGRVTNNKWIYCNRCRDSSTGEAYAYFSFLKQCPKCCQDKGLETRLHGAQHKPSSHHIGEITTTAAALVLSLICKCSPKPLEIGVIAKQNHDVDAVGWTDDLLVLFEVKASPLVTFPIRTQLTASYLEDGEDGPKEAAQHKLIDIFFQNLDLNLYLPNLDKDIPLGKFSGPSWPYPELRKFIRDADGFLTYFEAWVEIFFGYSIPKTKRKNKEITLGYLANGWGDEIDSNKTKAGLGRTDDIKKGTYQLLKFGAYYRDGSPNLPIRGTLLTNLDPIFMYADYMEKLIDARWAPSHKFRSSMIDPNIKEIEDSELFYIYDSVLAFNKPIINDPLLESCFDFSCLEKKLFEGYLDSMLSGWESLVV